MGFFNRATSIRESRFAPRTDIWNLTVNEGTNYTVAFLHDLDLSPEVAVHFTKTGLVICDLMYHEEGEGECMLCEEVDPRDGKTKSPAIMHPMLVYAYDLIGAKKTSKQGKEYDLNPLCILNLPNGKKNVVLDAVTEASTSGDLQYSVEGKNLWKIKRIAGNGFNPPTMLTPGEYKKFPFDPEVPAEVLDKVASWTPGELQGHLLSSFGNLKTDFPEFKNAGIVFPSKGSGEDSKELE